MHNIDGQNPERCKRVFSGPAMRKRYCGGQFVRLVVSAESLSAFLTTATQTCCATDPPPLGCETVALLRNKTLPN
jgi:hypothetical protein